MTDLPTPEEATDLDAQERGIYARFLKAGDGPAAFFLDACRIMRAMPRHAAAAHLVGHCIREIESAIRALLVPVAKAIDATRPNELVSEMRGILALAGIDEFAPMAERWVGIAMEKGAETQRAQIGAILREIGTPHDDPIATKWLNLSGARQAHRDGLGVRPADAKFETHWQETKALFDSVMESFEQRYLIYYDILDEIAAQPPTASNALRLKESIPRNVATYKHFFGQIDDPAWFAPLRRRGFFELPFPGLWPQATYLRKIASRLPSEVAATMMSVDTDSPITHMEFADAACLLPNALTAQWALQEATWIRRHKRIGWLLPDKYGQVVAYLASGGEFDAASAVTAALLESPEGTADLERSVFDEPPTRLEVFDLEQFCDAAVEALVTTTPSRALDLFLGLLKPIVAQSSHSLDESEFWRPSISEGRRMYRGLRDELITAVIRAGERAIDSGATSVTDVLSLLDTQTEPIFRRIALHIVSRHPQGLVDWIERELGDLEELVGSDRNEHRLLLKAAFPHLPVAAQHRLREMIDAGPDLVEFSERIRSWRGSQPSDDELEAYRLRWQTDLGELIVDAAGSRFADDHRNRSETLARIRALDREPPGLPLKTETELRDLGPRAAAAYAMEFLSQEQVNGKDELARNIGAAAEASPEVFSADAQAFQTLPAYQIAWYFHGLAAAVKKGTEIAWAPVVQLAMFVANQPFDPTARTGGREYGWSWPRMHVAWLLHEAFRRTPATVTVDVSESVASLLLQLASLDAGDEQPFEPEGGTIADRMLMRRLNSVRGVAIETLVDFLVWARDATPTTFPAERERAFEVLSGVVQSGSLVARCAVAATLGSILDLVPGWIESHLDELFPEDDAPWEAAFVGFVTQWTSSPRLLALLGREYDRAVDRLSAEGFAESHAAEGLMNHLMALYWRGTIQLEHPLLRRFFERAPGKRRGRAMWFVTRSADQAGAELDPDTHARLDALWEWRIAAGAAAPDRDEELNWFGYYITHVEGSVRWQLENLLEVLRARVRVMDSRLVVRLGEMSDVWPVLAFDCYDLLLNLDRRDRHLVHEHSGRKILCNALSTAERHAAVRALINSLAADGVLTFRDVLTGACDEVAVPGDTRQP